METVKQYWKKTPTLVRRVTIFLVGWTIVLMGILMLVLPGPGLLAILLGFAILATEFAFAARLRAWTLSQAKQIVARKRRTVTKPQPEPTPETAKHSEQ